MPRSLRVVLALLPVVCSLLFSALPGRAQQAGSSRYAFADTTLLRDTLGLDFRRLFPAADSLQVSPDSLRAWMIRWRWDIPRLVFLADSLGMPVDSVGPVLWRERYNPLASATHALARNEFRYSSSYDVQKTSSTWTNLSLYNAQRGPYYLNQTTNIELIRTKSAGRVIPQQTRESTTELGSRFSKTFSLGGQARLYRFNTRDPGAPTGTSETLNEFQFSARSKQQMRRGLSSELNLRAGYLDDEKPATELKRGATGTLDGRVRAQRGSWFSHDLSGQANGNVARTRRPEETFDLDSRDFASSLRGTMQLFNASPYGLNVGWSTRRTRVEQPVTLTVIDTVADDTTRVAALNQVRTANDAADATLRLRRDSDRYLNLSANLGKSKSLSGARTDKGAKATLRWMLFSWAIDGNYNDSRTRADITRQRGGGGYIERSNSRSAQAQATRSFGRITTKFTGDISRGQFRYAATADSATPPATRDSYRQSWRVDGIYVPSQRLTTNLAFEVSLTRAINLEQRASASNSDTRTYRGTWVWNYRLLRGLTATQTNSISADYQFYPFNATRNQLSLSYSTDTRLAAVVTPRLNIDLRHTASEQPRGSYTVFTDGNEYLQLSDDNKSFGLSTSISYRPSSALAVVLTPDYSANERSGTTNGVETKQRDDKRVNFTGSVQLDLPISRKGRLTGRIGRTYSDQRSTTYTSGVGQLSPRAENDFWNGRLEMTWAL
ncbi:MAG: hypothetical protein HZA61_15490 [Candidatus Eisenbacteria bacterium]|uniref:Uncharacterized protein n=1 Tax=Eiseniibacteriota bacterium TaxID=2212470 RepID=A0A933W9Q7_UNCEI|nr:hypothetical protein [Candidatus Eisenbacteria bacterium]